MNERVIAKGEVGWSRQSMAAHPRSRKASRTTSADEPSAKSLEPYRGQWVAFRGRRIISAGKDLHQVLVTAREKLHGREPKVMDVPSADILLL